MLQTKWSLKTWGSFLWSILFGIMIIVLVQIITSNNSQTYQKNEIPTYIVENSFIRHGLNALL
jgi:hypothetical protein